MVLERHDLDGLIVDSSVNSAPGDPGAFFCHLTFGARVRASYTNV
jgi:hypothetical protein